MFHDVRENLDDNLGRLVDLRKKYENHDFLSENRDLKRIFDDAAEMLDNLSDEDVLRPYKEFLDKFNKIESMLNEVRARCLHRQH
jgi:predicted RNA-binding protein with EMAP domain